MSKFLSTNKSKIVWTVIVIGVIAILIGAYQYALSQPVFVLKEPPSAVLQIEGVDQKGHTWSYYNKDNFTYIVDTSNKALVTTSPFSATLKFTANEPPQTIHIEAFDSAKLGRPTEISHEDESYFRWNGGIGFANITNATLIKDLDLKNEQTFTLEFKRGVYIINVRAKWIGYDIADYGFLVEVK